LKILQRIWSLRQAGFRYLKTYGMKQTFRMAFRELKHPKAESFDLSSTSIIFVTDLKYSSSSSYRIENLTIRLSARGQTVRVLSELEFENLFNLPGSVKIVYFLRCALSLASVERLIGPPGKRSALMMYDVDDIIFDENIYKPEFVSALRNTTETHRKELTGPKLEARRSLIQSADYVIASTEGVARAARKVNSNVRVVGNSPLPWMNAVGLRTSRDGSLKLVYASGSDSHDADFKSIWGPIQETLVLNTKITLTLLGHSPMRKRKIPKKIRKQVLFRAPVAHCALVGELSKYDVNLAPVELDNPFVEGKSNLKAQHAALAGIATIATGNSEFRAFVDSGFSGLLANTSDEWRTALQQVQDPDFRIGLAVAAQRKILAGLESQATQRHIEWLIQVAENFTRPPASNRGDKNKIVWVLDGLPGFSGGHRNVLRAASLRRHDIEQIVLVLNSDASNEDLQKIAKKYYSCELLPITSDHSVVRDADFVVATHHLTVDFVRNNSPSATRLKYFVQDLEALFYPVGDDYAKALRSLMNNSMHVICSGVWIAERLEAMFDIKADSFNFPINREIYSNRQQTPDTRNGVVFFLKPDSPRRLHRLALETIKSVRELAPNLPITTYGDKRQLDTNRYGELNQAGKPKRLESLAQIYRENKIGVVFSPTNPSLIPYEMMACGLVVVDCGIPGITPGVSATVYGQKELSPDPQDLARRIIATYFDKPLLENLREIGFDALQNHPDEEEMANLVISFILKGARKNPPH